MDDRAKNTCVFFQHVVVCSGIVWSACTSLCKKFRRMCRSLCMVDVRVRCSD